MHRKALVRDFGFNRELEAMHQLFPRCAEQFVLSEHLPQFYIKWNWVLIQALLNDVCFLPVTLASKLALAQMTYIFALSG
jgi:hypothetical protein